VGGYLKWVCVYVKESFWNLRNSNKIINVLVRRETLSLGSEGVGGVLNSK